MNSELRPKTSKGDIIVHATTLRGCHLWGRRMCTASQPQPQPRSLRSQLWPPMLCCARPWFFTSFSQFHSFRKSLPPPVHTLLPTSSSPYSPLVDEKFLSITIQQGFEIHGLKLHGPRRCTFLNWFKKILRWTNLCSENLEQHGFLIILPLQKLHEIWAARFFSLPQKRASQGLTVV